MISQGTRQDKPGGHPNHAVHRYRGQSASYGAHSFPGAVYLWESGLSRLENSFKEVPAHNGTPHLATGTAGLPWTTVIAGTELVTTLPAVTTAPSPISTSGRMIAPGPTKARLPIFTPRRDSLKCTITMTPIPIKTLSSIVINRGNSVSRTTWELIQTFFPMLTPRARCNDTRRVWPPGKIMVKI